MFSLYSPSDLTALALSLRLAALTSLILLILGTPLALWLARTRSPLGPIVEAFVSMPLVLPPTVLGFYLLCLMSPDGPFGGVAPMFGLRTFSFSFVGVLFGSVLYSLPFVVQALQNAFMSVSVQLLEAAQTLRASPASTFFSIVLPLSVRGFLSGALLAFAHTLGEFGVVLMIGGSIPGRTQTASIAIFSHVETLDYRSAHVLSATLVVLCFALLAPIYFVNRKARAVETGL
ncbi:MAG: molybdate transporter permease subunit [Pseudomonadota bacterium]|jgi:molybdate transport system permease protein